MWVLLTLLFGACFSQPRVVASRANARVPTSKLSLSVAKDQTPALEVRSRASLTQMTPLFKVAFRDAGFYLGEPIYMRSFKYSTPKLANYISRYNTDQSTRNRMLNGQVSLFLFVVVLKAQSVVH